MSFTLRNDRENKSRPMGAANPQEQEKTTGVTAMPPPFHLTAEPVELKSDEEKEKVLLKKKNSPNFADDGTGDPTDGDKNN